MSKRREFSTDVVQAMRCDVPSLADDPRHAGRLLMRLAAALEATQRGFAAALGLSRAELSVLLALWNGGRATISDAADRVGVSRAYMTAIVDRLVGAGYLDRFENPRDRRQQFLLVTPSFDEALIEHASMLTGSIDDLDAVLAHDDWRAFGRVSGMLHQAAPTAARLLRERKQPRATRDRRDAGADAHEAW